MITIKKRNFLFLLVVAIVIGSLVSGGMIAAFGMVTDRMWIAKSEYDEYKENKELYGELTELRALVEERYYVPVEEEKLNEGILKGLFAGLGDPYSAYLTKQEYDELMIATTGEYEGIGVTIAPDEEGYINVVAPMAGSPAEKAGILSGDRILKVDETAYGGDAIDEAAAAMRGKEGTTVSLSVLRGKETLNFVVRREKITMETVTTKLLDDNIGYIRISSFEEHTADDFEEALRNMELKQVDGLVIDLRDNPGGLVDAGVAVADQLLPEGIVTYTEDRQGEKTYYKTAVGATDLPYVVLVNNGTASSSEIVAAAIKDFGTAPLVGVTTYGKGIIQEIEALDSGAATKLTVMQYFSPKGNVIHKVGVEPDYEVKLSVEELAELAKADANAEDPQLEKAEALLLQ